MAQVYKRIANPFMPQGTPDKTNAPSPYYAPGELGCIFNDQNTGNEYLRVQVDSGATSSTPSGAIAAGQVAYWKNFALSLVTNDSRFCDAGPTAYINRIAGVFQLVPTNYAGTNGTDGQPKLSMVDLIVKGQNVSVLCSTTPATGQLATGVNTTTTPTCTATAVGTAAPSQIVGVWTSATAVSGSLYPCDVNVQFID